MTRSSYAGVRVGLSRRGSIARAMCVCVGSLSVTLVTTLFADPPASTLRVVVVTVLRLEAFSTATVAIGV